MWSIRRLWDWLVSDPTPVDTYEWDPDHDEAGLHCRACDADRSLHQGVRICPECDLIERMPNGSWADIVITDDHLPDDAEEDE